MKNESNKGILLKISSASIALLLGVFVMAFSVEAQVPRRNNQPSPKVTPTPIVDSTLPVIISRAQDIPSESRAVEIPPQTVQSANLEEKLDKFSERMTEMNDRLKSLESTQKNEYDEKQKRLLLNLDILTKTEQRAESLRKQLYDLVEKENSVRTRLEQVNIDLQPAMIERSAALAGSLRPEEIREQRQKALEAEKNNLQTLLSQMQASRASLEENVNKADLLVEKVRAKTEREIDDALADDKENTQ